MTDQKNKELLSKIEKLKNRNSELEKAEEKQLILEKKLKTANNQLIDANKEINHYKQKLETTNKKIAKQKQTEEELQKAYNLFQAAEALGQSGSWILNLKKDVQYWSQGVFQLHGLSPDIKPSFKLHLDSVHPKDRFRHLKNFNVNLKSGESEFIETYRILTKDRKARYIQSRYHIERDNNGNAISATGTDQDITERKLHEQSLKESKNFNEILLNTTPDIIYIYDIVEQKNIYSNDSINNILGYTIDEILEMGNEIISKLMHPDDFQTYLKEIVPHYENTKENELIEHEYRMKHKNGNWVWLHSKETVFIRLPDGRVKQIFGIVSDINERKEVQKQLEFSQKNYETIFDASPDSIFLHDFLTGEIIDVNQSTLDTFGYSKEEIKKLGISNLSLNETPYSHKEALEWIKKATIEGPQTFEWLAKTKNGDLVWFENNMQKINIAGNERILVVGRNIDDRMKAETALRKSEDRYKNFITHSNEGIYRIDMEPSVDTTLPQKKLIKKINSCAVIGEANKALSEMYGLTQEEMVGRKATEFAPNYGERASLVIQNKSHQVIGNETEDIDKNGNILYLLENYHGKIHNNHLIHIWGVQQDITIRKMAQDALMRSEEKFKFLSAATFEGIVVHKKGIIVDANESFLKMTGYSKGEAIGKNLLDYIPYAKDKAKILMNIVKQKTKPYLITAKHKNGKAFIAELEAKNVRHNNQNLRIAAVRDVTKRIKAEENQRLSEDRFRKLIEHMPNGVAIYIPVKNGKDFKFIDLNKEAEIITNSKKNEIIGNTLLEKFPNMIKSPLYKALQEVNETSKDKYLPPFYYKDNVREGWRENYIYKLQSGEIVAIFTDVTDKKTVEHQLKNQNIDLKIAKERAEESDRLKSAFLANMSHEIRTPMNGILGFADLLKETELSGQEKNNYISIIENSGKRMLNIINDLIDISKVEAGQMEINISEININELIKYLYTFFEPEAERKGLNFSIIKHTVDETLIYSDKEKVYAILSNLIKNAIKYSNKGSIEFGYNIISNKAEQDNVIQFFVKDNGIGIPINRQKAIFDRFVQADIDDRNAMEGAGLGLSICKAYVEMLNGKIWVESQEGIGSQFYFTIPYMPVILEETEILDESKIIKPKQDIKNLKILIAEDEEFSSLHLSILLKQISREILHCENGKQAVEICKNNPDIDLILMDIKMPIMGGYEASRLIRSFNNNVKIIAQTAYALEGDKEKAIQAGCDDYIAKPISKKSLFKIIEKYFSK